MIGGSPDYLCSGAVQVITHALDSPIHGVDWGGDIHVSIQQLTNFVCGSQTIAPI
jgi:hypothetical protein